MVGIGLNVAVQLEDFPPELRETATTLGLEPNAIDPLLQQLLAHLAHWTAAAPDEVLDAVRARDALLDQPVRWAAGDGRGAGIDDDGRLLVTTAAGSVALEAGEVHLVRS